MNQLERGSPQPSSKGRSSQANSSRTNPSASSNPTSNPSDRAGLLVPLRQRSCGCDLAHYTAIQAAFSGALAQWQSHWSAITTESMAALAAHGIAISYRQGSSGGFIATLLHNGGGGIDSGLCPTLSEARSFVLGQGLEDSP
jgi:hypothetical protein